MHERAFQMQAGVDAVFAADMLVDDFHCAEGRLQKDVDQRADNRNHAQQHIGQSKINRRPHFFFRYAQFPAHAEGFECQQQAGDVADKWDERQKCVYADTLFRKRDAEQAVHGVGVFGQMALAADDFLPIKRGGSVVHDVFLM